mgnify:CR=1 FL=1
MDVGAAVLGDEGAELGGRAMVRIEFDVGHFVTVWKELADGVGGDGSDGPDTDFLAV